MIPVIDLAALWRITKEIAMYVLLASVLVGWIALIGNSINEIVLYFDDVESLTPTVAGVSVPIFQMMAYCGVMDAFSMVIGTRLTVWSMNVILTVILALK